MEKKARKAHRRFRPRYMVLLMLFAVCLLLGVYISQQSKLQEIREEQAGLQAQLDQLTTEKQRSERMLEYVQTDEYMEQYIREKLNLVLPDDILFYEGSSHP